jgi:hypothetical protein
MAQEEERNRSGGDYALDSFRRFIPAAGLLEAGPDDLTDILDQRSVASVCFWDCLVCTLASQLEKQKGNSPDG